MSTSWFIVQYITSTHQPSIAINDVDKVPALLLHVQNPTVDGSDCINSLPSRLKWLWSALHIFGYHVLSHSAYFTSNKCFLLSLSCYSLCTSYQNSSFSSVWKQKQTNNNMYIYCKVTNQPLCSHISDYTVGFWHFQLKFCVCVFVYGSTSVSTRIYFKKSILSRLPYIW